MKIFTESERREIADKINKAAGRAAIAHPLPDLFINTYANGSILPAEYNKSWIKNMDDFLQNGTSIVPDVLVCTCPVQPFVDWAVFATCEGRSHLLHRFRLN